jgi:curved DNA-binding protein CbpA
LSIYCSDEDIKNSYRQLCKIYHPDRNPNNESKFIEIKVRDLLELKEEQLDLVRKIKEIGEQ